MAIAVQKVREKTRPILTQKNEWSVFSGGSDIYSCFCTDENQSAV